jgi:hypothetical protein
VFLKRWTAGRHSLPSHGNSQWPRPADGRHWRRWRCLFHGAAQVVVVRTSGSVRRAADGQQPTAVGTNSTVAELWQIVGALGRCCLGYLQPSDDPSRSLTIRCSCRARLLGSDTEEVTWAAPEVPSSHGSAVRNREFLRQRMTLAGRSRAPGQATAALCSEAALLGGLGGSSWPADQNVQPDSLLEQMLEPWTVD